MKVPRETPFAYLFRQHGGVCELLEFASEAHALEHAELNPHRYRRVYDRDGRVIWENGARAPAKDSGFETDPDGSRWLVLRGERDEIIAQARVPE